MVSMEDKLFGIYMFTFLEENNVLGLQEPLYDLFTKQIHLYLVYKYFFERIYLILDDIKLKVEKKDGGREYRSVKKMPNIEE